MTTETITVKLVLDASTLQHQLKAISDSLISPSFPGVTSPAPTIEVIDLMNICGSLRRSMIVRAPRAQELLVELPSEFDPLLVTLPSGSFALKLVRLDSPESQQP